MRSPNRCSLLTVPGIALQTDERARRDRRDVVRGLRAFHGQKTGERREEERYASSARAYAKAAIKSEAHGVLNEIAKFLEPEEGSAGMLSGAAELYVRIAEDVASGKESDRLAAVERFVKR